MAPGGVVAHSSPPAEVAAHSSPFELSPQLLPFFLQGTQSSSTQCLWMKWARNQCFVTGCPEQVQYTMMDGHVCKAVWRVGGTCR